MLQHQSKPPTSNTGALTAKVDWLQVTFPLGTMVDTVKAVFGPNDWTELDRGRYGYKKSMIRGHLQILFDGSETMGVHVVMTGQGCREIEGTGLIDWRAFLNVLLNEYYCTITRLDVAIDDKEQTLQYEQIKEKVSKREFTTRYRQFSETISEELTANAGRPGRTMYFGSQHSKTLLRIYDKGAEQKEAESWLRIELQTRDEKAQVLALSIINDGECVIPAVILGLLDFKEVGADSQRDRWKTCNWWAAFLGAVEKVRLTVEPVERTIEKLEGWLYQQVAPALAVYLSAAGGDLAPILAMAESGRYRWKKYHHDLAHSSLPSMAV